MPLTPPSWPSATTGRARSTPSPWATPSAERGGWFFDRQTPPDSLHATVHAGHLAVIDDLCADLVAAVGDLAGSGVRAPDRGTTYGTV